MEDKVSVIIIIYKVEKYLRECLESVVTQTYKNLEIICVVGKGDTECERIVDEYAAGDERIKVIKSEPKGPADARNRGLDAVTGDHIAFVDGDDRIADDMIEVMVGAARKNEADISVVGKYYLYENCVDGSEDNREEVLNVPDAIKVILYQEGFFLHLWDKLYKILIQGGSWKTILGGLWITVWISGFALLIGTLVGSRLGHCLFYQPDYYFGSWKGFLEIFAVWNGGLASHGGALMLVLCMWWFARK